MKKKLRIAQIAPLWVSVPPRTYGGTELMVYNIAEGLLKRQHKVTLFASGDSHTNALLIPPLERGIWLQHGISNPHAPIIRLIKMAHERLSDFDLIHNHFNFFPFPVSLHSKCPPFLTTVHRPVDTAYAETMKAYPKIKFCAISEDHKKSMEEHGVPVAGVVYNGIDMPRYEYNNRPNDYLLYLGRINSEKGILTAIEAARVTGQKLIVAGNIVGEGEWLHFMHEIQPLLHHENINFRGQVNFEEKIELLKNAKALLFPINVREAFGLVMTEAMACGTPVIAFLRGSVPEIVEHGKTGFVVDTKEKMIEAIKMIGSIDRAKCRESVEKKFSLEIMIDRYEKIYEKIIGS